MTGDTKGAWQRKDGLYVTQVTVRRPDGTSARRSLYGHSEAEVLKKKANLKAEQAKGRSLGSRRAPTLNTYMDSWLTVKKVADIRDGYFSETTLQQYRDAYRRHIGPHLGHLRLDELTPVRLRAWLELKASEVSAATGKPLGPASRKQLHAVLRSALNDAKRDELIHDNPLDRVRPPRGQRATVDALTGAEVSEFLAGAKSTRLYALWLLLFTLGLRINEALALRWEDIDLEQGTVEVFQSLARVRRFDAQKGRDTEHLTVKSTKVPSTDSSLVLPPITVDALHAHRIAQNRERLRSGTWHESGLIFTTTVGTALDNRNLLDLGKKLAKAAGVERNFTVHKARHTAATGLLAEGVSLTAIQKLLRHTRSSTTADLYLHTSRELQQSAADAMESRMRRLGHE